MTQTESFPEPDNQTFSLFSDLDVDPQTTQRHLALARKWRPATFDALVGQDHVVQALSHALENQRLHHAYLLTGTRGVGKTTLARILAKAVNCERGISKTPCGQCGACVQIAQGRFVDLLEVDAATNTRVDEMRALLENAHYTPTAGRYKVYVIDEVHMLSTSAFNAMLKTLEEPPPHVLFVLATTDPQKIPATVLSRCLQFGLRNVPPKQVASHLAHVLSSEGIAFDAPALLSIGKAARGSVRDALSLTDQAIAYSAGHVTEASVQAMLGTVPEQQILAVFNGLVQRDAVSLVHLAEQLANANAPFETILDDIASWAYRLQVQKFNAHAFDPHQSEQAIGIDADEQGLLALCAEFSSEELQLIYQVAVHARAELYLAPSPMVGFAMALLRMLMFKPLSPLQSANISPSNTQSSKIPSSNIQASKIEPSHQSAILPESSVPPSSLPSFETWPQICLNVPAKGLMRQVLAQTQWVSGHIEGAVLKLVLSTAVKPYTEPSSVLKLQALLSEYFQQTVDLKMQLGEAQHTAAVQVANTRGQMLEAAKNTLANDPVLQDLQHLMQAKIVPGSEQNLNASGPSDL